MGDFELVCGLGVVCDVVFLYLFLGVKYGCL